MSSVNVLHSYNLDGNDIIQGGVGLPELKFTELLRAFGESCDEFKDSRIIQINITEDGILFHLEKLN